MPDVEVTVIGAGVVGLAIAARLSERSHHVALLEKNAKYGMETSSRNSEVIHAGIYYKPGSLKALLCVEGRDELYALCRVHDISMKPCGKLIIATRPEEIAQLETLYANGRANGVKLEMFNKEQTLAMEPHINAVAAIHSPLTGVISAHDLMGFLHHKALSNRVTLQQRCEVQGIRKVDGGYELTIAEGSDISTFTSEKVVNAAGLQSDMVAASMGIDIDEAGYRMVYARGSYFVITPSKANLVSRLIYPVPQNEGIGVHAVLDWGGRLKFGPDVEYLPDRTLDYTVAESKRKAFAESIRKILPQVKDEDITPDMSGIRPKLQRKGEPARDFIIVHEKERGLEGVVNLIGIESPGLTSSPAIARHVEKLLQ